MRSDHAVAVIGGGQAGLSMSYCLKRRGIDHVVLERHRAGHDWRTRRWDSLCLVTPNWQCRLPGFPYAGGDPHGFMTRDEVVAYIEDYVAAFGPPLREGVSVATLRRRAAGGFELSTSAGELSADQVVVATGGYHVARIPRFAERLPDAIVRRHSSQYRNPESLPPGDVLVVGSGQSGCQIAEDLHLAGRRVHLCVGGATRAPRRYRGRDVVAWLDELGCCDLPVREHKLGEAVRSKPDQYVTGRDGGHDIDLRALARDGMRLYGRLTGVRGSALRFAPDLTRNLDAADAAAEAIKDTIDELIASRGLDVPAEPRYTPVWEPAEDPRRLDLATAGITSVIWCIGYRPDYRWIDVPIFDGRGRPCHERGVTAIPGFHLLGLQWLHTWGSGRFAGIARDAEHLAEHIARGAERRRRQPGARRPRSLAQ